MSSKGKILLVEDDRNFGDVLSSYLEMNDYDVILATDGEMGYSEFQNDDYDLCIFDVMMPKKDGFTLAKEVREEDGETPIIFLTAKNMTDDVIKGFKSGADDYMFKPFAPEELLYRIQAILKRSPKANRRRSQEATEFTIGQYHFDYTLRALTNKSGTQKDKLSPKEADLLRLFCLHQNEVLPRSVALKKIWGEESYFTARSMDVFVTKLRKYLKGDNNIEIVNIHGEGFLLRIKEAEA